MHAYLAFDIETVINERAEVLFALKEYKPDPQYNDLDQPPVSITKIVTPDLREERMKQWREQQEIKIQQSIMQKKQRDIDQAALSWWTGKIVCIGWQDVETGARGFVANMDERELLNEFFKLVQAQFSAHTLIGKRSGEFDTPYLVGRAMAHDIGLIPQLRLCKEPVSDVNRFFGQSNSNSQVPSLANLAHGLCIDGKTGHGSDVAGLWARILIGDQAAWGELTAYCQQDVDIVATALKRWRKDFTAPSVPLDAVPDEIFGT